MSNSKVIYDFSKYRDADLDTKAQKIADDITGNVHFPNPVPTVSDLQLSIDAYGKALAAAKDGTKEDTSIKNQKREKLEADLVTLSTYVQTQSGGDEAIILSSGFDAAKKREHIGLLEKPENFKVLPGPNNGSVALSVSAVPDADFYEFQYREAAAASGWQTQTSKKKNCVVDGLTSGKQYSFRVAAAGSDPGRVWSDENNSYVL